MNGGKCHHVDGSCDCPAGYIGDKCQTKCPTGKYGINCANDCTCQNGADCNFVTGHCTCLAGYTGTKCSKGESLMGAVSGRL